MVIWQQIRANRIRSIVLVFFMGALLLLLGAVLGMAFAEDAIVGLVIAVLVWVVMNLVALFAGDSILLGVAGAKKITAGDYPRLYNVVEEMKIASGLEKMPDIYIIDDPAINAFATGRNADRASVAVTSGLLQRMNRDELQGVIAHEISHIRNRDVLLMAITSVTLGTIVIISWYASRALFWSSMSGGRSRRSSDSGGGGGAAIFLIIGLVLAILAPIAAQLLYFAISRRREYLADASAALYTRYPEGLASALQKIGSSTEELKSANQATASMYIANPFRPKKGQAATDLSSTHPPLSERIRILRSMAGGSFADYNQAYQDVHQGGSAISASVVALTGAVPLRAASAPESQPLAPAMPLAEPQRAREVSDVLWRLNDYRMVDCDCGARLKVPPSYQGNKVVCPRCGRENQL